MSGSKKQTIGYRYFIGAHMLLGRGPIDKVYEVQVAKRRATAGSFESQQISIDKPELFGGKSREGGIVGDVDLEFGATGQGVNDYLEGQQGTGVTPAYRGVFAAVLRQVEIGQNPYLKPWSFRAQRIYTRQRTGADQWYPAKAGILLFPGDGGGLLGQVDSLVLLADFNGTPGTNNPEVDIPEGMNLEGAPGAVAQLVSSPVYEGSTSLRVVSDNIWGGPRLSDNTLNNDLMPRANDFRFTIAAWIDVLDPVRTETIFSNYDSSTVRSYRLRVLADRSVQFTAHGEEGNGGASVSTDTVTLQSPAGAVGDGAWHLYRVERVGDDWYLTIDGSVVDSELNRPFTIHSGSSSLKEMRLGFWENNRDPFEGYMDSWEMLVGEWEEASILGVDMNPAHMIREAITDPEWGMGFGESEIGSSFTTAADTLYAEGFGLSGKWEKQAEVEEFIQEILAHIDAYVYVDNATGLWEIKLIRNDYTVGNLPVIDSSHVVSLDNSVERIDPIEAINSVTVKYTNAETGDSASITAQDQALIAEAGAIHSTSLDFEFIRHEALAARVAMRELLALSSPILSGTVTVNRAAPELSPGDPFVLDLPRYYINSEVVRASNIVYDEKNSERVTITFASDVFELADASLVNSDGSVTSDHRSEPAVITRRLVEEAPYWSLSQLVGDSEAESRTTTRPELGYLQTAGESPTPDAVHAQVSVNPGSGYIDSGVMDFTPAATLNGAIAADASVTSVVVTSASDLDDVETGTLATISGTEMVRVDSISGTTVTVGRGCLDTPPQAHADGAGILFWGADPEATDETEYADSESVDVKLLTVTGLGTLDAATAPADTVVFDSRAARPLPVGKLQLDGEYVPSANLDDTDEVLTWVHRDRLTQTSTVIDDFTAASIGPESGVDYTVLITWRDVNGDQTGADLVNTSVGTALTYTLTSGYLASRPGDATELWFEVQTLRDGLREWTTPIIKAPLP